VFSCAKLYAIRPTTTLWAGLNSFWLNLFSRLGLPGVLAFAMLILALFRYIWQHAKRIEEPQVKAFVFGSLAGLIGQTIIWLVNNTYILPGGGLNFWFLLGILVGCCRTFAPQPQPELLPVHSGWISKQPVPA